VRPSVWRIPVAAGEDQSHAYIAWGSAHFLELTKLSLCDKNTQRDNILNYTDWASPDEDHKLKQALEQSPPRDHK
jgi:hypothetical protein